MAKNAIITLNNRLRTNTICRNTEGRNPEINPDVTIVDNHAQHHGV